MRRRADIVGAISAATAPCIPFTSYQPGGKFSLPLDEQKETIETVKKHMRSCRLDEHLGSIIAAVAAFNRNLDVMKRSRNSVHFEPDLVMENYYYLMYQLLSEPEPLRDFDQVISPTTGDKLALHSQDFPTPNSLNSTLDSFTDAVMSAMRILAILYLREPTLDLPCGEAILLDLLARHTNTILQELRLGQFDDDLHIDPLLLQEMRAAQRATLIWICIAGDLFSAWKLAGAQDPQGSGAQPSIYRDLLRDVLGPELSSNPDLVTDEDLELCHHLNFQYIKNDYWNERDALRDMLGWMKTE
ncbi:hypothetical protein BX600DRAFT_454473 [Xylariales sp. PMI_506]|nr:hypothetical protein BX600DRAFT_454473 [Xylariales sp. PMI_506]